MQKMPFVLSFVMAGVSAQPVVRAADLLLRYTNIQTATNSAFTTGVQTFPSSLSQFILTPPPGTYLRFSVVATVVNNPNTPGALATGLSLGVPQPAQLGIASFATSFTNSNPQLIQPLVVNNGRSTAIINSRFSSTASPGVVEPSTGNVGTGPVANTIYGGVVASSVNVSEPGDFPALRIGTTQTFAGDSLFANLTYLVGGGASFPAATLTPSFSTANIAFVTTASDGYISPDATTVIGPSYTNRPFNPAIDTITGPGPFTIGLPEPASLTVFGVAGAALLARRRRAANDVR